MEIVADLRQEAFDGREASSHCPGYHLDTNLVDLDATSLALEDISSQIHRLADIEVYLFAEAGDFAAGLDVGGAVVAVEAHDGGDDDLFEVRDVDELEVEVSGFRAAGARGREGVVVAGEDIDVVKRCGGWGLDPRGFGVRCGRLPSHLMMRLVDRDSHSRSSAVGERHHRDRGLYFVLRFERIQTFGV